MIIIKLLHWQTYVVSIADRETVMERKGSHVSLAVIIEPESYLPVRERHTHTQGDRKQLNC